MGYYRAGFDIVGVDHRPQPRYPFEFVQADALEYGAEHGHEFDAIHASPPCQRFSVGTPNRAKHPNLIGATREVLLATGKPYVIENVPQAPIRPDIVLEGAMVGLERIKRRRHFETEPSLFELRPDVTYSGPVITVTGHGTTSGNRATWGRNIRVAEMREAMGIDWMNRDELAQAIPPAYTEYVGRRLLSVVMKETNNAPDTKHHAAPLVKGEPTHAAIAATGAKPNIQEIANVANKDFA